MLSRLLLDAFALGTCSVNTTFDLLSGFNATIQVNFSISEKRMTAPYVYSLKC
jgi:hypothetical protein